MFYSKAFSKILKCLLLSFLLIHLIQSLGYSVSLDYPFLLTNQNLNIVYVNLDFNNNIYSVFSDGSVRKYLPDLSSYINLAYVDPV